MKEQKHDRFFGPSMWPKLLKCPAYQSDLSQNSPAAQKGTELHLYLQEILEGTEKKADLVFVQPEEVNGIHWATKVIENSLHDYVCEQEITVYGPNKEERTCGTADIIGRDKDGCLVVMDLKTGYQRDYTLQIMAYAIGVMQREGEENCKGVLIYSRSKTMDSYEFKLGESIQEMENLYAERCSENPRRYAGEYCKWCSERKTCPKTNTKENTESSV